MRKTQKLYDPYIQPKNGPGTIAPKLIGHSPSPVTQPKPRRFKKPKPEEIVPHTLGNPEGGKDLFDLVFVLFIIYLVCYPFLF